MTVKKKMNVPEAIRLLLKRLRWKQPDLALRVGVSLAAISLWKRGKREPYPKNFAGLAMVSPDDELRDFFLERAPHQINSQIAIKKKAAASPPEPASLPEINLITIEEWRAGTQDRLNQQVQVPIRGTAGAGGWRIIAEKQIESFISIPVHYCPKGPGDYFGLKVRGDSMEPKLGDGFIVVIDPSRRSPQRLRGHTIAARHDEGVVIKKLARDSSKERIVLHSLNPAYKDIVIDQDETNPIIGEVVFWWGFPKEEQE